MSEEIVSNRSALREFLASIATISGDLSNITAPPFVLAEHSTVEVPQYWGDHPLLFIAPAAEPDAQKRALLVLKWFLGSLRNQQYAGRKEGDGVKKPLNAFLGELFFGSWKNEELGETRLVAEQVSHHPPVTACYLWNDQHGVRAEGFTQQEITFSGNVSIKQKGYAVLHIDKYDENYLLPVPNVKVKGILSGVPYPELSGEYSLISSNGYISHVKFEGKGFFGSGQKNGFEARLFHQDQPETDIYTIAGAWNGVSSIKDSKSGDEIESFDVTTLQSLKMHVPEKSDQDPWESKRAWADVSAALRRGDMRGTTNAKSVIEEGQRQMRRDEQTMGTQWKTVFFQKTDQDAIFDTLAVHHPSSFTVDEARGIWKIDREAVKDVKKPYHGDLLPTNKKSESASSNRQSKGNGSNNPSQKRPTTRRISSKSAPVISAEPITATRDLSHQKNEHRVVGKDSEQKAARAAEGASEEKNGAWKSLSDNLSTIGSTLTAPLREISNTGSAGTSEEEKNKKQPADPAQRGIVDAPEPTDRQVEDFLRAKYSTS